MSPVLSSRLNRRSAHRPTVRVTERRITGRNTMVHAARRATRLVRVLATFAYDLLTGPF